MSLHSDWLAERLAYTPPFKRNNEYLPRERLLVSIQTQLATNYLHIK